MITLSGILFENTSLRAALFAHVHSIGLLDFAVLGHGMRAVVLEILFFLLELFVQFIITEFT